MHKQQSDGQNNGQTSKFYRKVKKRTKFKKKAKIKA